jgi:hypothetical protein
MITEQIIPFFEGFKIKVGNISLPYPQGGLLDSPQSQIISCPKRKEVTRFRAFIFPGEIQLDMERVLAN